MNNKTMKPSKLFLFALLAIFLTNCTVEPLVEEEIPQTEATEGNQTGPKGGKD